MTTIRCGRERTSLRLCARRLLTKAYLFGVYVWISFEQSCLLASYSVGARNFGILNNCQALFRVTSCMAGNSEVTPKALINTSTGQVKAQIAPFGPRMEFSSVQTLERKA